MAFSKTFGTNPIQLPAHHDNPGHLCEGGSYSSEMGLHRGGSKTITGAQKLNGSYYGWKIPKPNSQRLKTLQSKLRQVKAI